MVTARAFNHNVDYVAEVQGILNPKGFLIASLIENYRTGQILTSGEAASRRIWHCSLCSSVVCSLIAHLDKTYLV